MSSMNQMKQTIQRYTEMLPVGDKITKIEADRRAGEFLVAAALLTEWKHLFTQEKIKFTSVQTVVFAEEVSKGTGKTITENKLAAEASTVHITAREDLERIENDISYLKTYLEIVNNAHIFYRNLVQE